MCDLVGPAPAGFLLTVDEQAYLRGADPGRRAEFTAVRWCAGEVLHRIGVDDRPHLVPGPGGNPPWPAEVVGSMTHTHGHVLAAAARTDSVSLLGIDAEPNRPLTPFGRDHACSPDELAATQRWPAWVATDRLIASCKEAFYKAVFPRDGKPLQFPDVRVTLRPDGTFTARERGTDTDLPGRWQIRRGNLVTVVALPGVAGEGC